MTVVRRDSHVDVSSAIAVPAGRSLAIGLTVVACRELIDAESRVVVAVPGGTYHRRYWDLQPPGLAGYSQAEWHARRGDIFVACDYLGGGDSTRPEDGDFMTLEVAADAAHAVFGYVRDGLRKGDLVSDIPPLSDARYVGIGQSLGGFITMMQQGKYQDFAAIGIFGASPILIANIPDHRRLDGLSPQQRRAAIMADNARSSGLPELPMYHGAPRENFKGIFHVLDVADDLIAYDEQACHTLISRVTGADGMTPGISKEFADRIDVPVFLAFGASDVSADPHAEPAGYPSSPDVTVVVLPKMAHMHNFADTREQLWGRFEKWLAVIA